VAREQDRDQSGSGQQADEHDTDLSAGEASPRKRRADHDRPQPVGNGPRSLDGEDPACVGSECAHR
jgi:hypothetical protein